MESLSASSTSQLPSSSNDCNMTTAFPKGIIPMRNQIAGHTFGHQSLGMLESNEDSVGIGYVYKPLLPPPRGQNELAFYNKMFHPPPCTDQNLHHVQNALKPFLPKFYDHVQLDVNNQMATFLKLENINTPFSKPCAMDIKIGRVSYDPLASKEKQDKESQKSSYQKEFGFRILGMIIQETSKTEGIVMDKTVCKSIRKEELKTVFEKYLTAASVSPERKLCVINEFICRLTNLLSVFTTQTYYAFYASSLLFVYEGDDKVSRLQSTCAKQQTSDGPEPVTDIRMIDFAHVFTNQNQTDENYIFGLKHLISLFEGLHHEQLQYCQNAIS